MCQLNGHGHNLGEELGSGLYFLKGLTMIGAQTCEDFFFFFFKLQIFSYLIFITQIL